MREVDAAAAEPTDVLVGRAAHAVAREVVARAGGYGTSVVVVAGPGNNGADGRVAAALLRRRGARCVVVDTTDLPARLPDADVVIDAAFGTGLRDPFEFPECRAGLTVAVDIPSGVDGDTGEARGAPRPADVTVSFAAGKPGLYLGVGRELAGEVVIADIGLDVGPRDVAVAEPSDLAGVLRPRAADAHKWDHAVRVVAGSPGMFGAGSLCSSAAMRAGAGYVRWTPLDAVEAPPLEVASEVVVAPGTTDDVGVDEDVDRFAAWAVGPGLGRGSAVTAMVRRLAASVPVPVVLDADALWALGREPVAPDGGAARVFTPHDGEYERLMGVRPGSDRILAARELAATHHGVALLKGPTTVVAAPDGRVRLVTAGDQRLATAGTGDVLTGVVAACLAAGLDPFDAAWAASLWCALAARELPTIGVVAGDLPPRLGAVVEAVSS